MRRADYHLTTNAGPLVVHVVAIDTHDPAVHLGAAVAHDRMISAGETVSSMAERTKAPSRASTPTTSTSATRTSRSTSSCATERCCAPPSKRAAIDIASTGDAGIGYVSFAGTVTYGTASVPLTGVNEWPPQGGATLLTQAYGALAPAQDVIVATLEPLDAAPGMPGTYRVAATGPAPAGPVSGVLLGFGQAALKIAPPPQAGDTVTLAYGTTPDASTLRAAVGGGPLLVANGAAVTDPYSPAPEERDIRFPPLPARRSNPTARCS